MKLFYNGEDDDGRQSVAFKPRFLKGERRRDNIENHLVNKVTNAFMQFQHATGLSLMEHKFVTGTMLRSNNRSIAMTKKICRFLKILI